MNVNRRNISRVLLTDGQSITGKPYATKSLNFQSYQPWHTCRVVTWVTWEKRVTRHTDEFQPRAWEAEDTRSRKIRVTRVARVIRMCANGHSHSYLIMRMSARFWVGGTFSWYRLVQISLSQLIEINIRIYIYLAYTYTQIFSAYVIWYFLVRQRFHRMLLYLYKQMLFR